MYVERQCIAAHCWTKSSTVFSIFLQPNHQAWLNSVLATSGASANPQIFTSEHFLTLSWYDVFISRMSEAPFITFLRDEVTST
jgi:hypothetical protein